MLPVFLSVLLGWIILRNAWLSDDIYITFRYLYNWTHGHGLVWNTPERVQAFTHPAWLFALTPGYLLSNSAYFTALFTSFAFTGAMVVVLVRNARSHFHAIGCLLLLLASRSFIDFSTSGLENPLSHLLVVLFVGIWSNKEGKNKSLGLALVASLLLLNRLDFGVLVLPALLVHLRTHFSRSTILAFGIGFLPLIAWEAFSLIYYGFLLPNTFYAKASTGLPRSWLLQQGLAYFGNSLQADLITLPLILSAVVGWWWKRFRHFSPLSIGIGLYLLYVGWVGGDFMSGRFFSVPFVMAVAGWSQLDFSPKWAMGLAAALLGLALLHPLHPVFTTADYYVDRQGKERELFSDGIVDEKGMAWERSSWQRVGRDSELLQIEQEMASWGALPDSIVLVESQVAVGWHGYRRGPGVFIVDELALTDPLLARMPALRVPYWRIGHFFRRVPEGYMETVGRKKVAIADSSVADYYARLRLVTEGPIWSGARWREIGRFLVGANAELVDEGEWQTPTESEVHRFD